MPVITVTVNQWRIEWNAETGANEPVICVNTYASKGYDNGVPIWGDKIGETEHYHEYVPTGAIRTAVQYDPVNKTPCGASCWMEIWK